MELKLRDAVRSTVTGETAPPRQAPLAERIWTWAFGSVAAAAGLVYLAGRFHILPAPISKWVALGLVAWMISWLVPRIRTVTTVPIMMIAATLLVRQARIRFPGEITLLEGLPATLPEGAAQAFTARRAEIEALGFRALGLVRVSGVWSRADPGGPETITLAECLRHPSAGHLATILLTILGEKPAPPGPILRFGQPLPSGVLVAVVDSDQPGMNTSDPADRVISTRRGVPARDAYVIFQGMMTRFAPGWRAVAAPGETTVDVMRAENTWTEARWRRMGLVKETGFPGELRYTAREAFMAGCRMAPPIYQIRRWLMRGKFRRLRAKWGV